MGLIQFPDLDVLIVKLIDQIVVYSLLVYLFLEFVHFLVMMGSALLGCLIQQLLNFHKKTGLFLVGVENMLV